MCGIAGIIAGQADVDAVASLERMLSRITHRGPDDFGIDAFVKGKDYSISEPSSKIKLHSTSEDVADVLLGHRRLSIIDTSSAGHQPMHDFSGETSIVFNGEIYNYLELKEDIGEEYPWRTHSDTEVLLAAYRKWGVDMFSKLDGMFAITLYDRKRQVVVAARDIANIKPYYYHYYTHSKKFFFASEPQAIVTGMGTALKFDSTYLAEFMLLAISDHDQGCMIDGVSQLRGGSYLELDLRTFDLSEKRFYTPSHTTFSTNPVEFEERFKQAVSRQLRADVKVGTSLSGGIDSSAVVYTVGDILRSQNDPYNALTFTFPNFPDDEADLAKKVAANSGIQWHAVEPDMSTMANDLEGMIINMGEPFSSLSMFAQYKVMEHAQKLGIKVMLDGQGGDELYLGYPRMAQRVMMMYLKRANLSKFMREMKGLKENLSIPYWQAIAGNIYFNSKAIAYTRRHRAMAEFLDTDYLAHARKETISDFYAPKSVREKQEDELFKYCLPRLLRYGDRNAMGFGIEARVPHLSNLMIDKALNMPVIEKVNDGWTKLVLREYLNGKVPDEITWNKVKKGFNVPQEFWIKQLNAKMQDWVDGLPSDTPVNKSKLRDTLNNAPGNHFLWPVMSVVALNQLSGIKF